MKTIHFRGDLLVPMSAFVFKIIFWDTVIQKRFFVHSENNQFSGWPNQLSTVKETLVPNTVWLLNTQPASFQKIPRTAKHPNADPKDHGDSYTELRVYTSNKRRSGSEWMHAGRGTRRRSVGSLAALFLFKKQIQSFLDTLIQKRFYKIMKIDINSWVT